MAGVHRRQEIEALLAADFAEDDAIGTHTQRVDDEIADGDRALALEVGRAGFERQPVRLLQAEFGRVLDGDDALARVDHLRQGVEHGGLARTGTARDDDVHPRRAGDLEQVAIFSDIEPKPRIMSSVIGFSENLRIEMAVPRRLKRRDDDVDAAAVLRGGRRPAGWSGRRGGRPC